MSDLVWSSDKITCNVCKGGTEIPAVGCWLCNGIGFYQAARLRRADEVDPAMSNDLCACGQAKTAHSVIDGNVEIARLCDSCFDQYLRDRFASGLPVAGPQAARLGLRGAACVNCGSVLQNAECYIGGRPVCGPDCGRELLAKMPPPPLRKFQPTGDVTQLPLELVYKRARP